MCIQLPTVEYAWAVVRGSCDVYLSKEQVELEFKRDLYLHQLETTQEPHACRKWLRRLDAVNAALEAFVPRAPVVPLEWVTPTGTQRIDLGAQPYLPTG